MSTHPTRREFLYGTAALGLSLTAVAAGAAEPAAALPPVRPITRPPGFHWFGYYDKLQFDPTGRYVLGMEVGFEHRSPTGDDVIKVGVIDTADGDKWAEIGTSSAWGWQQGYMLQWVPASATEVLWNDRQDGRHVCHVYDVRTKQRRTIPSPVYTLSPDGKKVVIDSAHGGNGRQMYLIDIAGLTA